MDKCIACGSTENITSGIATTDKRKRISLCGICRKEIDKTISNMVAAGQRGRFVLNETGTAAQQGA